MCGEPPREAAPSPLSPQPLAHGLNACGVCAVRVQLDAATGQNKGYGFVAFKTRDGAAEAIKELNGAELKGKKGVRATLSESKFRLFIGNLPRTVRGTQRAVGSVPDVNATSGGKSSNGLPGPSPRGLLTPVGALEAARSGIGSRGG